MSVINLIQQIREVSLALEHARNQHDEELIEELEDKLFDLQEALEMEEEMEYSAKHNKQWE